MRTLRLSKNSREKQRRRSLFLEHLESRRLLASDIDPHDMVWPGSPRAAIELIVTDSQGYPISQIEQGDTFQLQAWVHEFGAGSQESAFASYVDVEFDDSLTSVVGAIDHGSTFSEGPAGTVTGGLLDEVGGFRDLENGPPVSGESPLGGVLIFKATMTADTLGEVVFSANAADDLPDHELVLVGLTLNANGVTEISFSEIPTDFVPPEGMVVDPDEDPVEAGDVQYGEIQLEIVAPGELAATPDRNDENPFDTNDDGNVSPIDLLGVVVQLRCQVDPNTSGCQNTEDFYTDVNGDNSVTRSDVVAEVNIDVEPAFAGTDTYVARLGEPLSISAEDGVLANDFDPEGVTVTASLLNGPEGMTLAPDGSFVWTPPANFVGDRVEFTYSASDGRRTAEATGRILVRDVDEEEIVVTLRTVSATGELITTAAPGDKFFLEAYVEDTRPRPEGVFAAYVDVSFDSALTAVDGAITFGSKFPNARYGAATPGRLDEVGGVQDIERYHTWGEVLLFSIAMTAESEGELTFASEIAGTTPDHHILLLGKDEPIPGELIRFGATSLAIIDQNRAPIAVADRFVGPPGSLLSVPANMGVLFNDSDPDNDELSVRLVTGPTHGTLTLGSTGSVYYIPEEDFNGIDTFTYIATDGELDSPITSVQLDFSDQVEDLVAFYLRVFDASGNPVDHVTVGDEFELRVITEDLRERPLGVFSAYLDVEYNASFVSPLGDTTFGDAYDAGREFTLSPGLIDETGGFSRSLRPIGGGEFLVFSQRFTATDAGRVLFSSNPADYLPPHEVLMYGLDEEIDPDDIDFGDASIVNVAASELAFSTFSLRILAEGEPPLGVSDSIAVDFQVTDHSLDVMANDSAAASAIAAVSTSLGRVSIAPGGRSLLYSAPSDFAGHDRFTYTVTNSAGDTEFVAVDVQVKSPYQNFALPTDTDADGHVAPIDALYGVNELNRNGPRRLTTADTIGQGLSYFLDVDGDLHLAPLDVLVIINELNARSAQGEEGEGEAVVLFVTNLSDGLDEAEEPSQVSADSIGGQNLPVDVRWSQFQESPMPADEFFARFASDEEPLLDGDLFDALNE